MFDISFFELLLIGVVALVVLGPERLPKVARAAGLLAGKMQRYVQEVKREIEREIEFEELKKLKEEAGELEKSVRKNLESVTEAFSETAQQTRAQLNEPGLAAKAPDPLGGEPPEKTGNPSPSFAPSSPLDTPPPNIQA